MHGRKARIWGAIAVGAIAFAACGGDDDDTGAGDTSGATAGSTAAADATTEPSPTSSPDDTATTVADSAPTESEAPTETEAPDETAAENGGATEGPADPSLDTIYIGWINLETGTPSFPDATVGARAAVAYMNAELGGIDGHPVELVECAAAADQESNQKCGQELANDERVNVVLSGLLFAGGPAYTALEGSGKYVLGRTPLTGADFEAPNVVFYGSGSPGTNLGIGAFLASLDEVTSVGVLTQDSEAGRGAFTFVEQQLTAAGKTATNVVVNEASPDFATALSALGDVDGVYIGLTAPSCTQIGQNAALLPAGAVISGATSCVNSGVWSQVPDGQEGWYTATGDLPLDAGPGVDPNLDIFIEKFPEYSDTEPGRFSNGHWANVLTLRDVLLDLGVENMTPESIGEALTNFGGPVQMGPSTVSCPGTVYPTVCVSTIRPYQVKDGKLVLVDPDLEIDFTELPG